MKLSVIVIVFLLIESVVMKHISTNRKRNYHIETADITRFWNAFDHLTSAHTGSDSLSVLQHYYLDSMSKYGRQMVDMRKYSSLDFLEMIRKHPKYLEQLRKKTENILKYKSQIDHAFTGIAKIIPQFNYPDVCFAIGCFRGGGTRTSDKKALLIGSEIAFADSSMNISEFQGSLHTLFSAADGTISSLIAHESIHCEQWNGQNNTLLSLALAEGGADFLASLALQKTTLNKTAVYGAQHECGLWRKFKKSASSEDISDWLYNSSETENLPADLGYFFGEKICESYYAHQFDKTAAIQNLLNRKYYLRVYKNSGYAGNCQANDKNDD